jgi:hypothetical protein
MEFFKLMPYFLLIISAIFIGMALFMFLRKKPLILNSVWMLIVMCLCFLPQILSSIEMLFKHPSFIGILPILMFTGFDCLVCFHHERLYNLWCGWV